MDNIGEIDLVSHNEYNKSAILMRMSDDVLSLLEKYALNQNDSSSKLTIKFDDSTGVIRIPNDGKDEVFNFSFTGSTAGRDSTYCVQETENRTLEAVALVERQKINIKPSVNSFEKTRSKIANQRKINRCREVEMPNSLTRAKKVAVKRSRTCTNAPNSVTINGNEKKKFMPYKGFDIVSQPLRKRIIHMLALKPCKKSEILDRLMKEGISEFQKSKLIVILYEVGFLKNDIFHLDPKMWKEVEDDWSFYSAENAAIVQRRKQKASQTGVILEPQNPPNVLPPNKRSLVDEIIAGSTPIQKKQKTIVKEENPGLPSLAQYAMRNSTPKNSTSPTSESKESNIEVTSPPSSKKKRKKNKRKKRKKNKLCLSNSEVKSYLPSTVINTTNPVLLKDSCLVKKITSPPVAPSSTVDDTTLDANRVSLNNSGSFFSFRNDSSLVQKTKVPFLKETQSNNTSQIVGKPTLSPKEFQNLDSFNPKSEETRKKDIFPSTVVKLSEPPVTRTQELSSHSASSSSRSAVVKLPEPFHKQEEFVPTDCIRISESPVTRTQELSSHSASSSSHSAVVKLPEPFYKQEEFVPTDCLRISEPPVTRTQELSSHSTSSHSASSSLHSASSSSCSASASSSSSHSASASSCSASAPSHSASSSHSILCSIYKILSKQIIKSADHDANDFRRKFPKITSLEQRNRCKELFDYEYSSYIVLLKSVNKAIERMNDLEENLKTLKEGTQEYEAALLKLFQVYKMYLENSQHRECSQLVSRYQKKLSYIRSLILEFDNEHYGNLSSNNSE
ncbi:RNA polymerase II elongation factor Ell-like [Argiope bruennichi]|uniref:RNA polymerase II elongation factor Ell-like n=1 Tax=Argiope bruennichi TaxID=94029 RepID=UPI0024954E93|nr:RNA polymerase II elongation factor Ell-like [Argiope bruennichi]